jgi:lipoyl-dependent peroxiredoxin
MIQRTGTAHYDGLGKAGKGHLSAQSGVLSEARYDFGARFENQPGTNPEELIAAAHAGCFTMALSFALAAAGHEHGTLDTRAVITLDKDGPGFAITRSDLTLTAHIPGIAQADFDTIVADAKANCPVSKVLRCAITLDATLSA